jgi:hypothetical protein
MKHVAHYSDSKSRPDHKYCVACSTVPDLGNERLRRSVGLRQWFIDITVTILEIIYCPVFYLKHGVSENGLPPSSGETYPAGPNR